MIRLTPIPPHPGRLRVLLLGAHSDDIEIGCAGTLFRWAEEFPGLEVLWAVFGAEGNRLGEARRSAESLLGGVRCKEIVIGDFADGRLPSEFDRAKDFTEKLARRVEPDLVFTHRLEDRHQDHRTVAELTWQTWRNHLILEYEIPKYEGDLGRPNVYVPLDPGHRAFKVSHLKDHFASQRSKDWFTEDTFDALMRLRGIECKAPYAEAFHVRKLTL
jgi:LmbE family N-acetylglucosaminyl deacetylase